MLASVGGGIKMPRPDAYATRIKLLIHDGFGVWCATRRLNRGGFEWPRQGARRATGDGPHKASTMAITREQFDALVLGLPWQRLEQMRSHSAVIAPVNGP